MAMVNIKCICGKELQVWHYESKALRNQKYCSRECQQKAYRMTDRGKAVTTAYNQRYKRPDREWRCFICEAIIISARRRVFCEEHNTPYYRNRKLRATRLDIVESIRHNDALHKRIKRGTLHKPLCTGCGADSAIIHFHHDDHTRPGDVVPFCPACHAKLKSGQLAKKRD